MMSDLSFYYYVHNPRVFQVGRLHLVLVEGTGKSIKQDSNTETIEGRDRESTTRSIATTTWTGRTDTNKRVVIPIAQQPCPVLAGLSQAEALRFAGLRLAMDTAGEKDEFTTITAAAASDGEDGGEEDPLAGTSSSSSAAALTRGLEAVAALVREVAGNRSQQQQPQPVLGEIEKGGFSDCSVFYIFVLFF